MSTQCSSCGKSIDKSAADATTGQTRYGAQEVDPTLGTRIFYDGKWCYFCSIQCRTKFMAEHKDI